MLQSSGVCDPCDSRQMRASPHLARCFAGIKIKESLAKYPEMRERLQNLLEQGEKITPKQWKAEIQSLQSGYDSISREKSKTATELAYAEVISYNKKNLERELQNESRQHNRQ